MTVIEWAQFIVLVVAIGISITVCTLVLIKVSREGFTKKWLSTFILALGLLFITYLTYNRHEIQPADWAQIMLVLGLVAVTGFYALSASRQADASVKMAKEMREQRYNAVRPVIDIINIEQTPSELARQAYAKEPPKELTCKLCNIGVGPAIEVYSFIEDARGETCRWDFGALPVAIGTRMTATGEEEIGYTCEMRLLLEQRGDRWFLAAYYKDVYGRWFESSREVRLRTVNPAPLQIREITEEELP